MISYHYLKQGAINSAQGYKPYEYKNVKELWEIISRYTWSPTIFKNWYRKSENFMFADVVAFDFDNKDRYDDPYTIEQAASDFDGYRCLIGTTRNHMREKNDEPAVPRFRLVIPLETRVHRAADFEATLKSLGNLLEVTDKSCHERARMFYPCAHIGHIQDGDPMPVKKAPDDAERAVAAMQRLQQYRDEQGILPPHVREFLETGKPFGGSRNKSLYVTGCYLLGQKLTIQDIEARLRAIPFDKTDFAEKEFSQCLKSIQKKIRP